jgi:hypothetical protein
MEPTCASPAELVTASQQRSVMLSKRCDAMVVVSVSDSVSAGVRLSKRCDCTVSVLHTH